MGFILTLLDVEPVINDMKDCEECGKKLGMLEGYRHPTMGKKHLLCSPCFDQVSDSVARWGEFVRNNSFNMNAKQLEDELERNAPKVQFNAEYN